MYGYSDSNNLELQNKKFYSFSEVAKLINIKGFGRNSLLKFLREKGILNEDNIARQDLIKEGYFRVNFKNLYPGTYVNSSGVSRKGLDMIRSLLSQ